MVNINIAIDGFAGCGKSTLAKDLAKALTYTHIDSGLMYRAVTYMLLKDRTDLDDHSKVSLLLHQMKLKLIPSPDCNSIFLDGQDITTHLKNDDISSAVSAVAALPEVRKKLVGEQIKLARKKGVVMDGRDIGTVVLPDAELKIFLTARFKTRVERRKKELADLGIRMEYIEIEQNLKLRDHLDSTRKEGPLRQADDAVLIDNTNLTRTEQLKMVLSLAQYRCGHEV